MKTIKAFSKQFFGVRYESAGKSFLSALIMFLAFYTAGFKITIAPFILYLSSVCFTFCVMWQVLIERRNQEMLQGMLVLPFKSKLFIFAYVFVLGMYILITKTLLIWALFFAVTAWRWVEIMIAVFCGCMACEVAAAVYCMYKKQSLVFSVLWLVGILVTIVWVRNTVATFVMALFSIFVAVFYLSTVNAYWFYDTAAAKRATRYRACTGDIFTYLIRYVMDNKIYLSNTAGLCILACFLPFLLGELQGLPLFPVGLALLCLNTPLCTLLSCNLDLERAVRVFPAQKEQFCKKYCLFIFTVNGMIAGIYVCSWQIVHGGVNLLHIGMLLVFALQSAILSVILEWKKPIRGWKTESDVWHHPRKYLVPLIMLLSAALISMGAVF